MARSRSKGKKIKKLRQYRDKLLMRLTNLEGRIRFFEATLKEIRSALHKEDPLRAYALAVDDAESDNLLKDFIATNEVVKELTLVYRMLSVERGYTHNVSLALHNRDYLRALALAADHIAESVAHDKMLSLWCKDHGFTRSLKNLLEEANEDDIC